MPACANCQTEFPEVPRRGKAKLFCGPTCRVSAGNARRATTRSGRTLGLTNPRAGEAPGGPLSPEVIATRPSVDRSVSDSHNIRLSELMAKAHSPGGVTSFEIALIAKMRGISAWAPLRVILAP
jgi:hypothetical protein